jgi:antitoxin component YwqK of YwqJK toxin-antitoxin module
MWREWHPNGRVASEQEFTGKGSMISLRTWSPEGEILEDRRYDA